MNYKNEHMNIIEHNFCQGEKQHTKSKSQSQTQRHSDSV